MEDGVEKDVRRVVITGMGVVSPVGNDVPTMWESLLGGASGGGPITHWDATEDFACRIGCEVKGFDPLDYLEKREVRRHDRVSQFAVAASAQDSAQDIRFLIRKSGRASSRKQRSF